MKESKNTIRINRSNLNRNFRGFKRTMFVVTALHFLPISYALEKLRTDEPENKKVIEYLSNNYISHLSNLSQQLCWDGLSIEDLVMKGPINSYFINEIQKSDLETFYAVKREIDLQKYKNYQDDEVYKLAVNILKDEGDYKDILNYYKVIRSGLKINDIKRDSDLKSALVNNYRPLLERKQRECVGIKDYEFFVKNVKNDLKSILIEKSVRINNDFKVFNLLTSAPNEERGNNINEIREIILKKVEKIEEEYKLKEEEYKNNYKNKTSFKDAGFPCSGCNVNYKKG